MSRNGGQSLLKFMYNADGIRTNKIVDGAKHVYTLNGTQIVSEAWGKHPDGRFLNLDSLLDQKSVLGYKYTQNNNPDDLTKEIRRDFCLYSGRRVAVTYRYIIYTTDL